MSETKNQNSFPRCVFPRIQQTLKWFAKEKPFSGFYFMYLIYPQGCRKLHPWAEISERLPRFKPHKRRFQLNIANLNIARKRIFKDLSRSSTLAVGEELVDRVDQAFNVRLRDEGGGAGRKGFAPVNLIGVTGVEDARYCGGDPHQCLA